MVIMTSTFSRSFPRPGGLDLRWEEYCDDRFSLAKLGNRIFADGTITTGGNNSVETTRLARTETRHDFLAHADILRASLYGRQG